MFDNLGLDSNLSIRGAVRVESAHSLSKRILFESSYSCMGSTHMESSSSVRCRCRAMKRTSLLGCLALGSCPSLRARTGAGFSISVKNVVVTGGGGKHSILGFFNIDSSLSCRMLDQPGGRVSSMHMIACESATSVRNGSLKTESSSSVVAKLTLSSTLSLRSFCRCTSMVSVQSFIKLHGAIAVCLCAYSESNLSIRYKASSGHHMSVLNVSKLDSLPSIRSTRVGKRASLFDIFYVGSSLATRTVSKVDSGLSIHSLARKHIGASSCCSVLGNITCGSGPAVRKQLRLKSLSCLDFSCIDSNYSVRKAVFLGSALSVTRVVAQGSVHQISVIGFSQCASTFSLRSRIRCDKVMSLFDCISIDSCLAVRSCMRKENAVSIRKRYSLCNGVSLLESLHLDSSCALRRISNTESILSLYDRMCCGSSLSLRRVIRVDSSISLGNSILRVNAAMSATDMLSLGSDLSLRGNHFRVSMSSSLFSSVEIGSSFSLRGALRSDSNSSMMQNALVNLRTVVSLVDCGSLDSAISVRSKVNLDFRFSSYDRIVMSSGLSVRAFVRAGSSPSSCGLFYPGKISTLTVCGVTNLASTPSVRKSNFRAPTHISLCDALRFGSTISCRRNVRCGSVLSCARSQFRSRCSILGFINFDSSISIRTPGRALRILGHASVFDFGALDSVISIRNFVGAGSAMSCNVKLYQGGQLSSLYQQVLESTFSVRNNVANLGMRSSQFDVMSLESSSALRMFTRCDSDASVHGLVASGSVRKLSVCGLVQMSSNLSVRSRIRTTSRISSYGSQHVESGLSCRFFKIDSGMSINDRFAISGTGGRCMSILDIYKCGSSLAVRRYCASGLRFSVHENAFCDSGISVRSYIKLDSHISTFSNCKSAGVVCSVLQYASIDSCFSARGNSLNNCGQRVSIFASKTCESSLSLRVFIRSESNASITGQFFAKDFQELSISRAVNIDSAPSIRKFVRTGVRLSVLKSGHFNSVLSLRNTCRMESSLSANMACSSSFELSILSVFRLDSTLSTRCSPGLEIETSVVCSTELDSVL